MPYRPGQRRGWYDAVMRASLVWVLVAALPEAASALQDESSTGLCVADATTLCLNEDRFRVVAHWETADGRAGTGEAVELTGDTGYFWFFSENNVEVVIKVLNGCAIGDGAYWVFIGGLTDVRVELEVEDVEADESETYLNEAGTLFKPVTDTEAFSTCD